MSCSSSSSSSSFSAHRVLTPTAFTWLPLYSPPLVAEFEKNIWGFHIFTVPLNESLLRMGVSYSKNHFHGRQSIIQYSRPQLRSLRRHISLQHWCLKGCESGHPFTKDYQHDSMPIESMYGIFNLHLVDLHGKLVGYPAPWMVWNHQHVLFSLHLGPSLEKQKPVKEMMVRPNMDPKNEPFLRKELHKMTQDNVGFCAINGKNTRPSEYGNISGQIITTIHRPSMKNDGIRRMHEVCACRF